MNRLGKVIQPGIAERKQAKDTGGPMFKSQPSQYTDLPESILLRKIGSGLCSDSYRNKTRNIKSICLINKTRRILNFYRWTDKIFE